MVTIAEKICDKIAKMDDTKVISISQPTQAQYLEFYQMSNLGHKIAGMLPYLSFMSFNREHLVFFNSREEILIDISVIFDSIFEVLDIICAIRN